MNSDARCTTSPLVDAHFFGGITPGDERTMRSHLPECARCHDRYERHLLLSSLDPGALPAKSRLGGALGLRLLPEDPPSWKVPLWLLAPVAVVALSLLAVALFQRSAPPEPRGSFTARGGQVDQTGADASTRLLVYRLRRGQPATLARGTIHAGDELAFAYLNGARKRRLLVFAVDDLRRVYWYYPAWRDPEQTPVAIPLDTSPGVHEIPLAVTHKIRGTRLTVFGVFLDQPLSVRQVEAMVLAQQQVGAPGRPLPLKNARQQTINLRVLHRGQEQGR